MANVVNALTSVKNFLHDVLGDRFTYCVQHTPKNYEADTVTVNLLSSETTREGTLHTRTQHSYQVAVLCDSAKACLIAMNDIEVACMERKNIPLVETNDRYLHVLTVASSQTFETETTDVYAVILVINVDVRTLNNYVEPERINHLHLK